MDDDDVIDYMIMEAVALKVAKEDEEVQNKKERKDWKRDTEGFQHLREIAG